MPLLSDHLLQQLRERFAERLAAPVELTLYIKPGSGRLILPAGVGCATCGDAQELAEGLVEAAPDHLTLKVIDVASLNEPPVADVPMLAVAPPGAEPRIRWQGLPAGMEFATVVDAIERVSLNEPGLSEESVSWLAAIEEPISMMVFATPT